MFKRYRHYSHTRYAAARNDCNRKINSAKMLYERRLATECKDNSKAFWRYVQSKRKVREGISQTRKPSGELAENDAKNVTELNSFLSRVFTIEKDITAGIWMSKTFCTSISMDSGSSSHARLNSSAASTTGPNPSTRNTRQMPSCSISARHSTKSLIPRSSIRSSTMQGPLQGQSHSGPHQADTPCSCSAGQEVCIRGTRKTHTGVCHMRLGTLQQSGHPNHREDTASGSKVHLR